MTHTFITLLLVAICAGSAPWFYFWRMVPFQVGCTAVFVASIAFQWYAEPRVEAWFVPVMLAFLLPFGASFLLAQRVHRSRHPATKKIR